MFKATLEYRQGHCIEYYRDDDDNSGYGGHAEIAHYYVDSTKEGNDLIATGVYPKGLIWKKIGSWEPDMTPGSAAWCEVQGDR